MSLHTAAGRNQVVMHPVSSSAASSTHSRPHILHPESQYVGAIDQGTSSTRFILFDSRGRAVRSAQKELSQVHPSHRPGWAEHDPLEIVQAVMECMARVMEQEPRIGVEHVAAIGLTNQRETTVVWDVITGKPLHNAIVWHDTRTADIVARMESRLGKDHFRPSCGLPLSTYFSALKLRWLLDEVPAVAQAVRQGTARFGTIDSWVIWNLTGGASSPERAVHVTDVTNASRTMLMNLHTLQWDERNCKEFGIPMAMLPQIRSCSEVYGLVHTGPLHGVPIAGCVGDQQAALLGQLCVQPGEAKNTYGTGCFMLLNTGDKPVLSRHGLLTTVAFQLGAGAPVSYALEGSVAVAGAGVRWLRDQMKLIKSATDVNTLAALESDSGGVYFVPAFSGLLSPHWRPDARGVICGLTHSSNSSHLARAVLESSAYQSRDVLEAMVADLGGAAPLRCLRVDGGQAASDMLMQFQADLLNLPVLRPAELEATATGAAYAAGLAVGVWSSTRELAAIRSAAAADGARTTMVFEPNWTEEERARRCHGWNKAVQRTLGWVDTTPTSQPLSRL